MLGCTQHLICIMKYCQPTQRYCLILNTLFLAITIPCNVYTVMRRMLPSSVHHYVHIFSYIYSLTIHKIFVGRSYFQCMHTKISVTLNRVCTRQCTHYMDIIVKGRCPFHLFSIDQIWTLYMNECFTVNCKDMLVSNFQIPQLSLKG